MFQVSLPLLAATCHHQARLSCDWSDSLLSKSGLECLVPVLQLLWLGLHPVPGCRLLGPSCAHNVYIQLC